METKKLKDEIERLKAENKILNSITYFKLKKYFKIIFYLNVILFCAFAILITMYELDSTLDATMPSRVAYILISAFVGFGCMMYTWYKLLWSNRKLKQCTYCKRIKVGNKYYDLPEFENVSYSSCEECSTALIPKIHKRHLEQIENGEI